MACDLYGKSAYAFPDHTLVESSRRVRQHGVDLAGVRGEIIARHGRAAIAARDVVEEPLELMDIVLDGLPELGIGAVLVADFIERLLALERVKAFGEYAALTALIALPQLDRRVVVDHPRDINR